MRKRNIDRRKFIEITEKPRDQCDDELENDLLIGFQSEVALKAHLDEIV